MTEIGTTGHGPAHVVGPGGAVATLGGPMGFDWWIGAEDRWHLASGEAAVRQATADSGGVIVTRLRVPGGDAVQRVACVPHADRAVAMIEIENDTPVPFAVALVVRAGGTIAVFDDTVSIDGRPVLRAGRSVARMFVADTLDELRRGVESGAALPPSEIDAGGVSLGGEWLAAIFPLPHTAVLRCAVALAAGPVPERLASPVDLPPLEAVGRGWEAHLAEGAEVVCPDDRLQRLVAASRRHLLAGAGATDVGGFWTLDVDPWVPAAAAVALDAWGHHGDARELLLRVTGPDDLTTHATRPVSEAGAVLWAWAELLERRPDGELAAVLAPWVEQAAIGLLSAGRGLFRRGPTGDDAAWRAVGLVAAGSLLTRWGNATLGPDIVDALPELLAETALEAGSVALALAGNRLALDQRTRLVDVIAGRLRVGEASLTSLAALSSATGAIGHRSRTQHPEISALVLLAVRRAFVDEPEGTGGVIALVVEPESTWLGAPLEGHRVPVTGGSVSFGVRWHGDRPALLWDIEGVTGVRMSSPGLDPSWSDERCRAEALLAAIDGARMQAAPESPEVRRGQVIDPGEAPESFG